MPRIAPAALPPRGHGERVLRSGRRTGRLGQAEVEHLDLAHRAELDVRRLEVSMDHAVLVRALERFRHAPCDGDRMIERERALLQPAGEILARDQLHREEAGLSRGVQPVDRRDVRVPQRGEQLRLAFEARKSFGVVGQCGGKRLERHLAVERRVDRLPDLAHAALADLLDDPVVQQGLARRQRHRFRIRRRSASAVAGVRCSAQHSTVSPAERYPISLLWSIEWRAK